MSFNISFLLLLLLCISTHACNARRLAVYKSRADDSLHILDTKEEKRVAFGVSKAESSTSTSQKSSPTTTSEDINVLKKKLIAEKNGRRESAVVSVPWRVPHSKQQQEKHPGFNLDYSPPKIHPPSHN